jgi:hypothetical protein
MSRVARFLFLSKGNISKHEAKELARAECARRGLTWEEPVWVHRDFGNWTVWTCADHRGGNLIITVDRGTGAIKAFSGPSPR